MPYHLDQEWQNDHLWARWIKLQTHTDPTYFSSSGRFSCNENYLTEQILRNRQHFQQPQLLKIWLWQLSHHKTISKFLFFLDSWRGSSPSPASLSPFSFQGMLSMDFIQYPKCQMWIDSMTSERMSPTPDLIRGQLTSLTCQENIMIITRGIRPGLPMNITTLTGQFLSHWSNQALLQDLSEGTPTHTLGISPMILGRYIIKKDSIFKNECFQRFVYY